MLYYIMEQINDDIDSKTDNINDDQITNIDNSQELIINTSDNNEKSTEQCSQEPAINEYINAHVGLQNKRSNYDILEDSITTSKADVIAIKKILLQEMNCRDKVKHLREENNSTMK